MWARLPASPAAITQRTAIQGEPLPDYFVGESRNGHLSACLKRPRKHIGALRGRDASYLAPPAQIRTCGFPAYGSHLGCVTAARCRMRANTLCHAYPALSPARAWLARIPLGPCPSLHQLRCGSLRFVRRLPSYYGRVRLLGSVHHRLRLLTFPMRAGNGNAVPVRPETSQLPMRSLCT